MPNHYVTVDELKESAPDGMTGSNTDYDEAFFRLARTLSRWIDNHTQRHFYPELATRYFDGKGDTELYIDDLIEITSVSFSEDDGSTYTVYAATDYIAMAGDNYNSKGSYNKLEIAVNGDYSTFPPGQKSIKIVGVWCKADDRDRVFEDTGDEVENNPLAADGAELTVNDVDGADLWGVTPLVSPGQLLQIESEYLEVTATDTTGNTAAIVRGVNGTTAAAHVQNIQVDKFMPPEPVKQACIIQAIHQFKRGQAGFGDAEALPDLGRIMHIKTVDPEALNLLAPYVKLGFG